MCYPPTLGLFQKKIAGDDCLLELARQRFEQAGLGAEMHAETPEELEWVMQFRPSPEAPVVGHLSRDFDFLNEACRRRILDFASRFAGRLHGLVIHDRPEMAAHPADLYRAVVEMDARMGKIERCPNLFIEYAAGLDPEVFAGLLERLRELTRVSACIDTGHVGIWQARQVYSTIHPGEDLCALRPDHPRLRAVMADVEQAVTAALPAVLRLIAALGRLGKPVHFHLHDAHPLSTFSPFGVADHLSFLIEIPLGFEHRGRRSMPLMFGPSGLARMVTHALESIGPERVSFSLEIHPTTDRSPLLKDAARLFAHWRDKTNAEQMNHWLSVLAQNHRLLLEALHSSPVFSRRASLPRPQSQRVLTSCAQSNTVPGQTGRQGHVCRTDRPAE